MDILHNPFDLLLVTISMILLVLLHFAYIGTIVAWIAGFAFYINTKNKKASLVFFFVGCLFLLLWLFKERIMEDYLNLNHLLWGV